MKRRLLLPVAIVVVVYAIVAFSTGGAGTQFAYVGPGAGFAFLGSFLMVVYSVLLSIVSLVTWPFRMAWRLLRRKRGYGNARVRKVIFLGLDGLDPGLTERYMAEGKLPNLKRLAEEGSYRRLRTTFPALSPVAWSTFATGVNPARHNIFDFLTRDLKSYVPELSSSTVRAPSRMLKLGRLRIPLSRPTVDLHRKSEPFWKILSRHAIGSTILRVPITFPPDKFDGHLLSAMCTPDLRGTQGSFTWFTTRTDAGAVEGGNRYTFRRVGDVLEGELEGPEDGFVEDARAMRLRFRLRGTVLEIDGERHTLRAGEYTPWVRLRFRSALGIPVSGIARFLLTETEPFVSLYVTPIQIDPEQPALPISHPPSYAMYLSKLLGPFATAGMAEDTWALNEGAIDEQGFLDQAESVKKEREAMFFSTLERTRRGVVACVFDTTDRVQHMFYRYIDADRAQSPGERYTGVIENLYKDMDRIVGRTLAHVDSHTALFVLSDHGFCSFRRGLNLNTWLLQNGYLALKDGAQESGRYFEGVDWSRTRAYTLGLGGLYLNVKGREAGGVVDTTEAQRLQQELIERLSGLRDPDDGAIAIARAYSARELYKGPYLDAAPDLIIGYAAGYRTSWDAAVGKVAASVFEDNTKAWSGDHCIDPRLVPGVFFCSRPIDKADPALIDIAPTALQLVGVDIPHHIEGTPLFGKRAG
jgi:predicted AlkP superfamily phosphohydrolase/phosphomutase